MRKNWNLVKCEFIKNYTVRNILMIVIILLVSVIVVSEFAYFTTKRDPINLESSMKYHEDTMETLKKQSPTLKNQFDLHHSKKTIEIYKQLLELNPNLHQSSWQLNLARELIYSEDTLFVINQMLDNPDADYSTNSVMTDEIAIVEKGSYEGTIYEVKEDTRNLNVQKQEIQKTIEEYQQLLKENKFYKFIEYKLQEYEILGYDNPTFNYLYEISDGNIEFYREIVSETIEDENDYKVISRLQKSKIYGTSSMVSEEEYRKNQYSYSEFGSEPYKGYVRRTMEMNRLLEETDAIMDYSIENDIKHDIGVNKKIGLDYGDIYMTSKLAVNQVFHLSIVVSILIILTSSGIISSEHSKRTVKNLFTSPIKREKILFSETFEKVV